MFWELLSSGGGTPTQTFDVRKNRPDCQGKTQRNPCAPKRVSIRFSLRRKGSMHVFEGRVNEKGLRCGRGRVVTGDGRVVHASWNEGLPCDAHVKIVAGDGTEIEVSNLDASNDLYGWGTEYFADGTVSYQGKYRRSERHGRGIEILPCGSRYFGDWEDGEFTGQTQYYIYPDGATALHGVWIDGTMITSKAVELAVVRGQCDVLGTGPNPLLPEYYVIRELADDVFKSDLSTSTCISSAPKLPDPYERRCVCRRRSSVTGGGQGLFARRLLPAGTTVAYYNGVRLPCEVANERSWDENEYTISLYSGEHDSDDDEVALDVPPSAMKVATDSTDAANPTYEYEATLGHFVNHCDSPNVEFEYLIHPRFGEIKGLRTLIDIPSGCELFVDYGYGDFKEREPPDWFAHRAQPGTASNNDVQ